MKTTKLPVTVWALLFFMFIESQPCNAEASLSFDLKPAPVRWIPGPEKAPLGDVAEIEIPSGYRFTDAKGARSLLEKMNNPVPKNLVGILAPETGGGWVMFEFTSSGYVRAEDGKKIDADALLKAIRKTTDQQNQHRGMQSLPAVAVVNWELKPSYDPDKNVMEWAIRAEYGTDIVINHTVRLLGRKGVLDAIAVTPRDGKSDLMALKQLLQCVSFKAGERYADFQQGDEVATSALAELIGDDIPSNAQQTSVTPEESKKSSSVLKSGAPWITACAVGLGGVVMLRRRSRRKLRAQRMHSAPVIQKQEPVLAPPAEVKNGSNGLHSHDDSPQRAGNSHGQSPNHRASKRKRRMFNYQKFYTDMMMQSASVSYSTGLSLKNGHHAETNGNGGTSHSHSNGNGNHNGESMALNETVVLQATSELLASQKALIHEQARLIEDQSRLIEEKYRLLERQSELLDAELTEH